MLIGIILAAGKGKRFKSDIPKVLHPLYNKPILEYVLDYFNDIKVEKIIVVVSNKSQELYKYLNKYKSNSKRPIKIVKQIRQLGSGDALKTALQSVHCRNFNVDVLVLNGDMPLISNNSLKQIIKIHSQRNTDIIFLTAINEYPCGYGRVIRAYSGRRQVTKITEEKDCTNEEKIIKEINAGVYCIKSTKAKEWLSELKNRNKQKEYYLTDLIEIAYKKGGKIKTCMTGDFEETQGINSRDDLGKAFAYMNQKIIKKFQDKGITILDPRNTYIGPKVKIEKDNIIYPNTFLNGDIKIGTGNTLGPNLFIEGKVTLGNKNNITYSHIGNSKIGNNNLIGPYARLRDNVVISDHVKIGNFVEIKNSSVGKNTQIAHLSYIGDATLGKNVNIGAGTITANYNSITDKKSKTIIKDSASTGSNSVLVAPVVIGERALVAAGSVVTKNVPKGALAITRPKQENKCNWVVKN